MPVPRPIPGLILSQPRINRPAINDADLATNALTLTGALTHSGGNVGFFGTTPASQQAALTAQHAALAQAGTDTGDVAIQAATNTGPYGFVNAAEFEAVVASLINLMTRVQELEDKLQAYGLLA